MRKNILFVDDDEIVLKCLETLLGHLDYDITLCSDGLKGLSLAKEKFFNLILVDYKMPNITGIELIKELKTYNQKSKYILISGMLDDEIKKEAHSVGISTLMEKPFDISKIVTIMEYL